MTTKIFRITDISKASSEIEEAARIIKRGGTVAIPTETVYGLGANGLDENAVRKVFEAKGRPQDNPLILHVADDDWIERYCEDVPKEAYELTKRFWPGPLTIILKRRSLVPDITTAGLPTVGMRCPDHPITNALIRAADVPIAAPSANISGRPSPTSFAHVLKDMDGKIDAIIDGGDCAVGLESTIIDLTVKPPRLLRPGGVTLEQLRDVLGEVKVDETINSLMGNDEKPMAPGMKYRHYAPKAPVTVVCGSPEKSAQYIQKQDLGNKGVLCFDEFAHMFDEKRTLSFGSSTDLKAQAERLFDALRAFDDMDVSEVFAQCPVEEGLGIAIANRLKKAAGFRIVDLGRD